MNVAYYEATKAAGRKGQLDSGNGGIGLAFRYGKEYPEKPRPSWTGAPSSFAAAAWEAGRDLAREEAERNATKALFDKGEGK